MSKIALIALFLVLLLPASAEAVNYGYNDDPAALTANVEVEKALGVTIARAPFATWMIDRYPGEQYTIWNEVDAFYKSHIAAKITPILCFWGAPRHARIQRGEMMPNLGWWHQFMKKVATRYPEAIIQAWNEPNFEAFGALSPHQVALLARVTEQAVHSVNPTQRVIGASPSPGVKGWEQYLIDTYSELPRSIDASMSLYPGGPKPIKMMRKQYRALEQVARGSIWITELGLSAVFYKPKRQAKWSIKARRALRNEGAMGVVFHRLQEPTGAQSWEARAKLWAIDSNGLLTRLGQALAKPKIH